MSYLEGSLTQADGFSEYTYGYTNHITPHVDAEGDVTLLNDAHGWYSLSAQDNIDVRTGSGDNGVAMTVGGQSVNTGGVLVQSGVISATSDVRTYFRNSVTILQTGDHTVVDSVGAQGIETVENDVRHSFVHQAGAMGSVQSMAGHSRSGERGIL